MLSWEEIARKVESESGGHETIVRVEGTSVSESGGAGLAKKAILILLGNDPVIHAVDSYVARDLGSELARSVLRLLRPTVAMDRCYQIYKSSNDLWTRRWAAELLGGLATSHAVDRMKELLIDKDEHIQLVAASAVTSMILDEFVTEDEALDLVETLEKHPHKLVKQRAVESRKYFNEVFNDEYEDDDEDDLE